MPTYKPVETTPDNLRAIADELARNAAELKGVADGMAELGFESLVVTNFGQLSSSVEYANKFLRAVRESLWNAREKRGDFGTQPVNTKSPKKKKGRVRSVSGVSSKSEKTATNRNAVSGSE